MSNIAVEAVTKAFGSRTLFRELSFQVGPGQMIALTGPSGSGKSTLLNCVGLLETVTSGSIEVDGRDITRLGGAAARRFRRDTLGYLFQNYALVENASVRFNLDIAVVPGRRGRRGLDQQEALEIVGLGGRGDEPVYQLSGGEQQRVALARLLVKAPTVVLADEPTGALDDGNASMVLDRLRSFASDGAAVLVATHSDRVVEACTGVLRVAGDGSGQGEVVESPGRTSPVS